MNIFETFTQAVPKAGPKAKEQIGNAQQRIDLLRARGFNAEADVFEQGLISKIQNKSFETMDNDFEEIAKFYGSNIKGAGATRPQKDDAVKAAMINAALAGFNARVDEASQRGVSVPPQLVLSIQSLIGTGRIEEAADLQEQTLGPVESATERRTRLVQEQETQKAEKARELESKGIVSTINRYIDAKGNPTQDLDDATGYFEEAATGIAKVAPFLGTQSPKSRASQQELSREIEKSIMAAAANLKPVSNFELKQLESRRPQISDPPEVWADYLSGVRDVIQKDKTRTDSEIPRELGEIQRATDLLRSKLKK